MNALLSPSNLLKGLFRSRRLPIHRMARRTGLQERLQRAVIESLETRTLLSATLHLVFSSQPSDTVAGNSISSISVEIEDADNSVVTDNNSLITFSIGNGPEGTQGTLYFAVPAQNGVATLDGLAFTEAGSYTLAADATNMTGAASDSFNITPGDPSQLVITQGPAGTTAGQTLSNVIVAVEDQFSNLVTTDSSTVSIGVQSGSGTLLGEATANASSGIATFSGLSITKADSYTLGVSDGELATAATDSFAISPASASKLVIVNGPADGTAGNTLSTITVAVEDQYNNIVTGDTSNVAIAKASGSGTVLGTATANAISGVATFSDLSIQTADTYTLSVTDLELTGDTTGSFTVSPDAAAQLAFSTEPLDAVAGGLGTVVVSVEDQYGNVITGDPSQVTLSLGDEDATLGGTTTVAAENGVATFSDLSVTRSGSYTLAASDGELAGADSSGFAITPGPASQLVITQDAGDGSAGATLPTLSVSVEDQYGNVVTGDSSSVAVALGGVGTLNGTTSIEVNNGVANFSDLSLNSSGDYEFNVTDGLLFPATSSTFQVAPAAANKLVYSTAPSSTSAGALGNLVVSVEDSFGNVVTSDTSTVTLSLAGGSGDLQGTVSVAAVNGVATFQDLAIHTADSYRITAADGELAPTTSDSFTISPADASQIAFTSQPSSMVAGNLLTGVNVSVEDAFGNVVTGSTAHVTFTVTGGGNTFHFVISASDGVAALTSIYLVKAGSYSVQASSSGLTTANSDTVTVDPASAYQLVITQDTAGTAAGQTLSPLQASVEDQFGNVVTGDDSNVAIAIASGSGTLLGTATVNAVSGVATFSDLSINTIDTYTLQVTDGDLIPATSASFGIVPALASQLVITTEPTDTVAGNAISNVVVSLEDPFGNVVTIDSSKVTIAIASGTGTLLGTATANAVSGVATFSTLEIDQAGSFTLSAVDGELTGDTSDAFTITPSSADHVAFVTGPASGSAGALNTITVAVEDAYNNVITSDTSNVGLTIDTGSGELLGTATANAVAGIATFSDLAIQVPDTYTLDAADDLLNGDTSGSFNITPAAPSQVVITQDTSDAIAGQTLSTVQVSVEDPFGNVVTTDTSNIMVLVPGAEDTLLVSATANAVAGVATFSDLAITKAGTFELRVSDGELIGATGATFTISPDAASQLAITQQPGDTTAGQSISDIQVSVEDQFGNVVTSDSSNITLAIDSGTGVLNGAATANATSGVATFSGLSIDEAGAFTLGASEADLAPDTSDSFQITPDTATQLVITTAPAASGVVGTLSTITVAVEDQFGNIVTTDASSITATLGGDDGSLGGTTIIPVEDGVATFSALTITQSGTFTINFSDGTLLTTATDNITLDSDAAAQLVFTQQPGDAIAGQPLSTVAVSVEDQYGNVVTSDSSTITLGINGGGGGNLRLILQANNGVATFSGAAINVAGAYELLATDGNLTSALSDNFTISPDVATQLVFTLGPADATVGPLQTVKVSVEDQFGNVVTSDTSTITLSLATGPGTLSGTKIAAAVSGVATFGNLSLDELGTYSMNAIDSGLASATSASFHITPSIPTTLVFTQQAIDTTAGQTISTLKVSVEDQYGNVVTTDNSNVTIAIGSGNGTLLGTKTAPAVNGVATFSDLSMDAAGPVTLAATDGQLTSATSSSFAILPDVATTLLITQGPTDTTAGQTISTLTVAVEDQFGNIVTGDSSNVSLDIATGSGTLTGSTTVQASDGIATFDDLSITTAGTITLSASEEGLAGDTSDSFAITPDTASQLVIASGPTGPVSAGSELGNLVVQVEDQFGNIVTGDTSNVAIALDDENAVVVGDTATDATGGIATFSGLAVDTAGTYTINITDDGLTPASVTGFVVNPAAPSQLEFVEEPGNGASGSLGEIAVAIEDPFGNLVTDSSDSVTILNAGKGGLAGTTTVAADGGIATFEDLSISRNGNYILSAASDGLTGATTDPFSLGARLVFQHKPGATVAGQTIGNPLVVLVEDSSGHVMTNDNSAVSIDIFSGPDNGTLDGTLTVNAVDGVASFTDLDITTAGSYKLVVSDGNLSDTVSNSFTITPDVPASLTISQDASDVTAGVKMAAVKVEVFDQFGNLATNSRNSVSLDITDGPDGGAIVGTAAVTPRNGVATFNALSFRVAGEYTLEATDGDATAATLTPFTVSPAVARKLVFNQQPGSGTVGENISPAITVDIVDAFGNVVTSTANVTLSLASGPSGTSFTTTVAATAGEAAFDSIAFAQTGTYKVKATATHLASAKSVSFTITPAVGLLPNWFLPL